MFSRLSEKCFIDCRGASVVGKPVSGDLTCQPVTLAIHSARLNRGNMIYFFMEMFNILHDKRVNVLMSPWQFILPC